MMQYGEIDLGQHWFRKWLVAWWHQIFTLTNVDFPLYVSQFQWNSSEGNFTEIVQANVLYNEFDNYIFKINVTFPNGQYLTSAKWSKIQSCLYLMGSTLNISIVLCVICWLGRHQIKLGCQSLWLGFHDAFNEAYFYVIGNHRNHNSLTSYRSFWIWIAEEINASKFSHEMANVFNVSTFHLKRPGSFFY